MKRQLLFAAALFASALGFNANAQELLNPSFDANEENIVKVTTEGYWGNIKQTDHVAGLQGVDDWTPNPATPNMTENASGMGYTGGVFAYGSENLLNNKVKAPAQGPDGKSEGVALGVVGLWGGTAQYTQEVTLPAGNYVLTYDVYNALNTGVIKKSLFGFIVDDDTEYLSSQTGFTAVGEWQKIYVPFKLENGTTGKISIGFTSGDFGSGGAPHLFVDNVSCALVSDEEFELAQAKAAKIAELNTKTITGESIANYSVNNKLAAVATAKTKEAVEAIEVPTYILTLTTSANLQLHMNKDVAENQITIQEQGTPVYLAVQNDGKYAISNGEEYINYKGNNDWDLTPNSTAYGWAFALNEGKYTITGKGNNNKNKLGTNDNATSAGSTCYGDKNNANIYWTIAEYNPACYVTVTDAEWATWVTPADIDFTDVDAYIVKEITDGKAQLVKVDNAPEGTPVIINAEKGTYQLDTAEDATKVEDNKLKISDGETVKGAGYYVLANINNEVGFYELDANYTLAKGKVYLEYKADNGVKFVGFDFGGETTAIKSVETAAENAVIYNLAGQRVQNPSAGIYIINGKKVLVK